MNPHRLSFLAIFCATAALAQQTVTTATLAGAIHDPSGSAVPAAKVTVRQTETNVTTTGTADREGYYRFPYLAVGPYELTVESNGFASVKRPVNLTVGAAFDLEVTMPIAASQTQVEVNAEAPVVEAARTQVAGTVSLQEVTSLPNSGRSFLDLALLVPGVSPTNTGSNQLFAETSAVPGQGISVGSQRNFSNSFVVDGLSANDDAAGLSGIFYGMDAIQTVQVITSGAQAELGRALGGYVNVLTKSGTNNLHADLYGYFRNQRFNAANPLSNAKLPVTQAQYGASLGGPLSKDRTFYFTNFEQRHLNQSGLTTISPANVAAVNARLTAVGYQGPLVATGVYSAPVHTTNFIAKVDHQISQGNQFNVRYSLYNVTSDNSRGAGALNAPSASAGLDNTDQTIAGSNVWTVSSRLFNETRGQYTRSSLSAQPTDLLGPSVSISGVASFGRLAGSPTGRVNNLYELVDNVSYRVGTHALKAGVGFLYNDATITYPRQIRGSYSFSSLANFLSGTYNNAGYTQTFGNSVVSQGNPNLGLYVQDEWKVAPRLTLQIGARYDLQFLEAIATDTNNVSPRLGFAWSPFRSRKTVVRGGFGLFYDRVPLRALANALLSSNNTTNLTAASQVSVSLSPTQVGAPQFPNIITTLPSGVLVNFTTMNPNMQNAYSVQGNFEIEQQLGSRGTLSIGYQHLRGVRLIVSVNQNVPTCVAAGTNNGCRPNPNYANNSQYSPFAASYYDGLHISYVQRPVRWGNYRVSYTFSKSLNNVGEFFFSSPIDAYNIWQDYGRSDDDQRHRVVFNGSVHTSMAPGKTAWQRLSHGFELSGMLQYYSALPFNITTGSNTVQGTGARPTINGGFISRNAGIGADFYNVNLRANRSFSFGERLKLDAFVEAFNAFNHRNDLTRNTVFGAGAYPTAPSATFGQITGVQDSRVLQLALRFHY
ncbi:MAG: TonB-dependent receptor [Bryobacteraceae bacterium]